jgi:FtsH-binding integral membrane protein
MSETSTYLGEETAAHLLVRGLRDAGRLLVSGDRFRVGPFAMGWLFATALLIGLGLGPVIEYFATVDADALTQAFAGTAATVLGAAALGFMLSKDVAPWMRPLSLIVSAACVGTIVWSLFGGTISPVLSLALLNIFSSD